MDELNELLLKMKNKELENEKHLKGYMFDSLVFRYRDARYKQAEWEVEQNVKIKGKDKITARKAAIVQADRDFMRFVSILDEAIGKHD